jgi:hypothetical protein
MITPVTKLSLTLQFTNDKCKFIKPQQHILTKFQFIIAIFIFTLSS